MRGYYYNDYSRKTTSDAILRITDNGIKLLSSGLSEHEFQTWFKYSREILEIVTKDNPTILLNYLDLSMTLLRGSSPPYYKLKICIEYLLETAKRI